jgi:hypothetical protein
METPEQIAESLVPCDCAYSGLNTHAVNCQSKHAVAFARAIATERNRPCVACAARLMPMPNDSTMTYIEEKFSADI